MCLVAETDLGRLLLEGHRVLAAEMVQWLDERGYPDFRAGYNPPWRAQQEEERRVTA